MVELVLKFFGPVIPVVVALIQLGRENEWLRANALRGRHWTFALIGTIILGGLFNGGMTWQTHETEKKDRQERERDTEERELLARMERQEISEGIEQIELALGGVHDPNLPVEEALGRIGTQVQTLQAQASKFENELEGLRKYRSVAELNIEGVTGKYGDGLVEQTAISRALQGAYTTTERDGKSQLKPRCDDEGRTMFEEVARDHPNFPFSHWALAGCLAQVGSPLAVAHARQAMEILDHTTQIDGHHAHHREVRKQVAKWLRKE